VDDAAEQPEEVGMRSGFRWTVLAAAALALAVTAPAHAAEVEHEPFEFSGEFLFFEGCPGGYDILLRFAVSGRATLWFDEQGDLVRIKEWTKGTGTLINSEDPTKTLTGSSPVVTVWDLRNMTFTVRGMSLHNNIPGEGRVAQDTGVLVFELLSFDPETGDFETGELLHAGGKHPEFDAVDWCSMVD
jgi:hypothetical protein